MKKNENITIFVVIIAVVLSANTSYADTASELNHQLFNAAKDGDVDQVKQLLEKGADVNTCIDGVKGSGPILMSVSDKGQVYILEFIQRKKADNDDFKPEELIRSVSSLIIASSGGHLDVVKYLVNNGADVNAATTGEMGGNTALMEASTKGYLDIIKFLVDEGADINAVTTFQGTTALMFASAMGHLDVVKYLVEKGADMSAVTNEEGTTALMFASDRGHLDIVKFLIEKGADINAVANFEGGTPLMIALIKGRSNIVKFLVENGVDVNAVTINAIINNIYIKGLTALMIASRERNMEIVKSLVKNGADINAVATNEDEETVTALTIAAQEGYLDILKLLIDNGADVNVVGKAEKTVKYHAKKNVNKKIEEYFKKLLEYNPFTSKLYKSTFTYFTQAEDITEKNHQRSAIKGLLKKETSGINDISNHQKITKAPRTHLEIKTSVEFDENKLVFNYITNTQSQEIKDRIPLYQQVFKENTANTHIYIIFPKEWNLSGEYQVIEAINNSDGSDYSIMACSPKNTEFSSLLRNYNALLEGTFWSKESDKSKLEKAVDTINKKDENERVKLLQEKYQDYQIYKIPSYVPEGITQAYSNIGRSSTIYFDKSSLTGNGKIFIEIPQITFEIIASDATKKAFLEGLVYELDIAEVRGNYKPEYRFVEESSGLKKKRIDLGDDVNMEFVYIPAGEFMMGSPSSEGHRGHRIYNESSQHKVKISKGFWMGVYEVTNGQYQQFVRESNYDGKRESNANYLRHLEDSGQEAGTDYPVRWVSWDNALAFCDWLSVKEGKTYRLPNEAQWEYACRAGRTTELDIKDDGLFLNTSGGRAASMRTIHPAGQNKPNPFGLYDMYDNVKEWCRDWYGSYSNTTESDPEGPSSGDKRVVRGDYSGSIISYRCAERFCYSPDKPDNEIGFRVVCEDSE